NGLRVIVHEDRKAPIIATNIWYHVGSKNELPGKTGFAHLFEHLMFNGSENHDEEYFTPLQEVGATTINGTTNSDRTNYFQTVPTTALDLALWLESDRMGHLLGVIDQDKLDEQRGVVQNEKRQRENQPYGKVFDYISSNLFPEGHPYSWPVIGSMEDLDAATLDDVYAWFRTYYGPNNATLVLAGDIDVATAREKVERYFGDIPPGPPLARLETWVPELTHERRVTLQDRVPQARIYKVWPIPEWGNVEGERLMLADVALTGGKTSRLYQRLVYEEQIATDVGSYAALDEIAGAYIVWATAQPGGDLGEVERLLDEELTRFLETGPTRKELTRAVMQSRADFVRGIERVGGFSGKSGILAESAVFGGRPDAYRDSLEIAATARPQDLRDSARRWLSGPALIVEVLPFEERSTTAQSADRSSLPMPQSFPDAQFPAFERDELANGMRLIVARRAAVPVVNFSLQLDAGFASDQFAAPGTAKLAMDMLDEGTATRDALEISEELAQLGAELGTGSNLDFSSVSLSALSETLPQALAIYSDVILNPAFPEAELDRLKRLTLSDIQREQVTPVSMALRVFPRLLYGEDHAYALPMTGSGTAASVAAITREDLYGFHATWFKPNNATMIVVGDTTMAEIKPQLEALFAAWTPGDTPAKRLSEVELPAATRVILLDRPGSEQSIIISGQLIPPKADERDLALEAANDAFGGSFTSRINLNLREDKSWSYGVRSLIFDTMLQRPFVVYAPVQTDKTAPSMVEIDRELRELVGARPVTGAEVETSKRRSTLTLPGRWETAGAVAGDIAEIVRFNLPDDFWGSYADLIATLDVSGVNAAARSVLAP
ncbi:MAG TPA: pitrilysin family protein, partial [Gammaproteobacteria bacterium]|nr:pitrilysin family protein [Gammaproteobacteria bacterium]